MTKSRENKRQHAELLGMPVGTAERKLRKSIIYELALQLKKNVCLECDLEISDPEDFAVVHVEDWRDEPVSFFDLANVAFSHASCRAGRHDRRQGEREMQRVEVIVEDSRGQPLRGCVHDGNVYVAGNKDQRYQVRVRNRTSQRLCLVVTVDGRNVNDGKKGSWDGGGFVLEAYQEFTFKGWRQSNDQVAAFRLGAKEDGYSSQMGSPQNTGVIGVAVFEEERPEPPIRTVKETIIVPAPYPVPQPYRPWPYQWTYSTLSDNTAGSSRGLTLDSTRIGGPTLDSTTISSSVQFSATSDSAPVGVYAASAGPSTARADLSFGGKPSARGGGQRTNSSRGAPLRSRSRKRKQTSSRRAEHQQELGTEYGESLQSKVQDTTFERATDEPCELHLIKYDSLSALKKAGIMDGRPSKRKPPAPQAFPESPDVEQGFCAPPSRRRFR